MATLHTNRHSSAAPLRSPAQTRRPRRQPKKTHPLIQVLAIFGWLGAIAAGIVMARTITQNEARVKAVTVTLNPRLQALQAEANERGGGMQAQQAELAKQISSAQQQRNEKFAAVQQQQAIIAELEPQLQGKQQQQQRLRDRVQNAAEEVQMVGAGLDEVQAKLREVSNERNRLYEAYVAGYRAFERDFRERLASNDPVRLRLFFYTNSHTPFAPAAGYFAGELFYAARNNQDAERCYRQIIRQYPDSAYAQHSQTRIEQLEARQAYDGKLGVIVYKAMNLR